MPPEHFSELQVESDLLNNVININMLVIDLIDQDVLCGVKLIKRLDAGWKVHLSEY